MTVISQKRTIVQNVQKKEELISKLLTIQILKKIFFVGLIFCFYLRRRKILKKEDWGQSPLMRIFVNNEMTIQKKRGLLLGINNPRKLEINYDLAFYLLIINLRAVAN